MKSIVTVVAGGALVLLLLPGFLAGAPMLNAASPGGHVPAAQASPSIQAQGNATALSSAQDLQVIGQLQAAGGPVSIVAQPRTGRASFVGADAAQPGFAGIHTGIAGRPEAAARSFLADYGSLFGVSDPGSLQVMKVTTEPAQAAPGTASLQAGADRTYVRYQQTLNGIPVMGGEVIVQVDGAGRVWSASGEAAPDSIAPSLPTTPRVGADVAAATALTATVKYEQVSADSLEVSAPELWYYASDLMGAPGPSVTQLVWRVEVTARDLSPIRELVLVDAITGKVPLHFNQIPDAKSRTVYNNLNNRNTGLPGTVAVRSEGQGPTGNGEVDKAYDYAGDTYDFYMSRFSRDSIDGKGMQIISTVKYCSPRSGDACPYPNAFWNGKQMVYGDGYASGDDAVAHELSHGVTYNESHLYYYMQSGALNEALSDIFGEFVDQTNGKGNDSPAVRWLMGEDIPIGAIRNMANPAQFGDPDSVESFNYKCDTQDSGAVHSNSGVANKAAQLMVDGGTLNGKTVSALGLEKSAQIWYRMATRLITSAAEYSDVFNALPQACTDLAATGVASITAADCQQVRNAVAATQMDQQPASCESTEAPVCPAGQVATDVYSEDFENQAVSLGRWTSGSNGNPNPWYYPQTNNPYGMTDFYYATSGLYHLWGDDLDVPSDGWMEMKNPVTVPATGQPYFRFRHAFGFESDFLGNYDAGVLEYSKDGGAWTDAGPLFTDNGYNGPIDGNPGSPLYGRDGFVGVSWGYGSSRLDLSSLKGHTVRFRFRVASDEAVADYGWFVDDVRLYSCAAGAADTPTPTPTATATKAVTLTPTATSTRPANQNHFTYLPVMIR